jgi:hypothetical protein
MSDEAFSLLLHKNANFIALVAFYFIGCILLNWSFYVAFSIVLPLVPKLNRNLLLNKHKAKTRCRGGSLNVETKAIRRKKEGGIACGIISAARYDDNRLGLLGRTTSIP